MGTCPICDEVARAHDTWLHAVADNVRLEQPAWLTLPTCRDHMLMCVARLEPHAQRAIVARYLQAALPASSHPVPAADPPARRRRNTRRWFDAAATDASTSQMAHLPAGIAPHVSCPGCEMASLAAQRGIASLLRRIARCTSDGDAIAATSEVCLKHFAEALIYAPTPFLQQRLGVALQACLSGVEPTQAQPDAPAPGAHRGVRCAHL